MSSDAHAHEDADELLMRVGAHSWTHRQAISRLASKPKLRAQIRNNLDRALKASAALLLGDKAPAELRAVSEPAEVSLGATPADAVLQAVALDALKHQIADQSRDAANAIAAAVELLEPIDRATWTTFCALSIGQSVEELIRATLPATFQHLDRESWRSFLAVDELSGPLAGGEELFSIAAEYEQLWPKQIDVPERMSLAESLQGLGVLEAMSREWETDYIIAVNAGGAIVGDYVGNRLKMEKDRVGFVTYKDNRVDLKRAQSLLDKAGSARVLILDDISRTGRTLRGVHAYLSGHSNARFQCASLVSAVPNILGSTSLYGFAAALTNSPEVKLPWATKGKLFVKPDRYVFGEIKGFPIMKSQAEAIQQELGLKD